MTSVSVGATRIGFLVLVIAGCGSCATSSDRDRPPQQKQLIQAVAPPVRATPPGFIPEAARSLLRTRMASHARDMSDLMSAVVNLRYVDAEALAGEIVDDVSLARPVGDDATELNNLLPAQFFILQDRAREDARAVADGAHRMKAIDLGSAYGRLSERCVACHALFRPAGGQPVR